LTSNGSLTRPCRVGGLEGALEGADHASERIVAGRVRAIQAERDGLDARRGEPDGRRGQERRGTGRHRDREAEGAREADQREENLGERLSPLQPEI
jgi:hypothetical protein